MQPCSILPTVVKECLNGFTWIPGCIKSPMIGPLVIRSALESDQDLHWIISDGENLGANLIPPSLAICLGNSNVQRFIYSPFDILLRAINNFIGLIECAVVALLDGGVAGRWVWSWVGSITPWCWCMKSINLRCHHHPRETMIRRLMGRNRLKFII